MKNIIDIVVENKRSINNDNLLNDIFDEYCFEYRDILDIKERKIFIDKFDTNFNHFVNKKLTKEEKKRLINEMFNIFYLYFDKLSEFVLNKYYKNNQKLVECMKYALLSNGKRIRAMMMFISLYITSKNKIYNSFSIDCFMLSIEMIHAFSLIHDDMPCIDNDELRRGKPSTWKKFGESLALLSGDELLNVSYEIINMLIIYYDKVINSLYYINNNNIINNDEVNKYINILIQEKNKCNMCALILSKNTGEMISGETDDVLMTINDSDINTLKNMYLKKTAALIKASICIGFDLSDKNVLSNKKYNELSELIGFSYQLQDDILELTMTTEEIGKSNNSDDKNNKITYIKYNGLEESKNELNNNLNRIIEMIENDEYIDKECKYFYKEIINYIFDRKK